MVLAVVLQLALRRAAKQSQHVPLEELRTAFVSAEETTLVVRRAVVVPFPLKRRVLSTPVAQVIKRRTLEEEELLQQEISGCKALLLEIVRRAAYDWVLYRTSTRLLHKTLAEQAFNWLFLEEQGTAEWREREKQGKHITSFVSICESLGLDVDLVRSHIRRLTPKNVLSVGRPAEYRRREVFTSAGEEVFSLPGNLVDFEPAVEEPGDDDGGNNFRG